MLTWKETLHLCNRAHQVWSINQFNLHVLFGSWSFNVGKQGRTWPVKPSQEHDHSSKQSRIASRCFAALSWSRWYEREKHLRGFFGDVLVSCLKCEAVFHETILAKAVCRHKQLHGSGSGSWGNTSPFDSECGIPDTIPGSTLAVTTTFKDSNTMSQWSTTQQDDFHDCQILINWVEIAFRRSWLVDTCSFDHVGTQV